MFSARRLALGDIPWRKTDPLVGAVLEIGLDPCRGKPCSNAQRDLLSRRDERDDDLTVGGQSSCLAGPADPAPRSCGARKFRPPLCGIQPIRPSSCANARA